MCWPKTVSKQKQKDNRPECRGVTRLDQSSEEAPGCVETRREKASLEAENPSRGSSRKKITEPWKAQVAVGRKSNWPIRGLFRS